MAINSIAPGFIIVFYNSNSHPHKHIIPIDDPQDSGGGEYTVKRKGGTAIDVDTAMSTWATAIKTLFHSTATLQYWELWTKASETADPIFRETGDLSIAGTQPSTVALSMITFNYRTAFGGNGKAVFMEQNNAVDIVSKSPYSGAKATVVTYLLGTDSIYAGRDAGFPVSVPTVVTKTSDALRKKYILNVS